jgi:Uma2 family endonuclease
LYQDLNVRHTGSSLEKTAPDDYCEEGANRAISDVSPLRDVLVAPYLPDEGLHPGAAEAVMRAYTMPTITQNLPQPPVADATCYLPFRMSVDQYEKLAESGVFTKRDKLHLIDGILVTKVTQNPPHVVADTLCRDALTQIIPAGWHIRSDKPVRLPPDSEPEPDQCVVRGAARDYSARQPSAIDVGLLVEVADSSLEADRAMARTYSARGIPVYWIINLRESQVEVYTEPATDGYGVTHTYKPGESVPVVLDGVEVGRIAVSDILP